MLNFTAVLEIIVTKLDVKTITTSQVVVNEKKHDLSMLINNNLRSWLLLFLFLGNLRDI